MKHRRLRRLLALTTVTAGFLAAASFAHARQNVTLHLHNTSQSDEMTCRVYRVVTNSSGQDVETLLHTLDVKPKSERAERVQNRPQGFVISVKHIARRIDRSLVYPRLKLSCELDGHNSLNSSPLWDNRDKSFSSHKFYGQCSPGRYCTARIDRR